MLGWLEAPKTLEVTGNIQTSAIWFDDLDSHPNSPPKNLSSSNCLWHILGSDFCAPRISGISISAICPGYPVKSMCVCVSLGFEGDTKFSTPTPSNGRPLPTGRCPDPKACLCAPLSCLKNGHKFFCHAPFELPPGRGYPRDFSGICAHRQHPNCKKKTHFLANSSRVGHVLPIFGRF